jgi:peptide-methionine (S)-S-oxide reductase
MRMEAIFAMGMIVGLGALAAVIAKPSQVGGGARPARLSSRGLFLTRQAREPFPPTELAAFAAGCFWGVEQEFRNRTGVIATAVGYSGGHTKDPTYEQVCTNRTGHAETVMVEYDPKLVSYDELLDQFWHLHDPTTLNRQGPDVGAQYRSAIFFHTPEQESAAKASKEKVQAGYKNKIVTEITPASEFYRAEDYHQQYLEKRGLAHCSIR